MPVDSISVVIAVYNAEKTISQVIPSILHQDYSGDMEVIVIDDGSIDKTADIIKTYQNVKYFYQSNQGPAVARNKGAQFASGEIIFFIDSDCVAHPNWISTNIAYFSDPSIAVVAGSYDIMNNESLLARCIHAEIVFRHEFLMPKFPKVFGSYNFSIRRKVFWDVGGFNTGYRYPSGEDNDLSYKVIRSGYKIYFTRQSLVGHYHTTQVWKYLKEQYRHGFWRVKMYKDHVAMSRGDGYTYWKDIIEIPIILFLALSLILLVCKNFFMFQIAVLLILFLFSIELYYAFRIARQVQEKFFLFYIMWLRSFARSFGFSSGILHFFSKKN